MKWYGYEDIEPHETQSEYVERKKREKTSLAMVILFFKLCFLICKSIIYYAGYLLMKLIDSESKINNFKEMMLVTFFAYCIYSLIFLLKGILIGLRFKGNRWWMFLWFICVVSTCIAPIIMTQILIESMIEPSKRILPINQSITWIASILLGLYVYNQYKFKLDVAPRIVWWSYRLGIKMIN